MKTFNYEFDPITGLSHPALYPGEKADKWVIPEDIRADFSKLNSIIETKYTREFLKICAFYNKMFPSLKSSNWTRSTYNVPAFTAMDQERQDTGTGIATNYLKQIIDQVVARIGTISFEPALLADVPTLAYIIYKDEVERLLRKVIRDEELNRMMIDVFHDAAVLGFSHVFIDPFTHKIVKGNDYEIGIYEGQFNHNSVKQMLYRDYAFPITDLVPYLEKEDTETREKIIADIGSRNTCDFKMYFDCPDKTVTVMIGGTALTPLLYDFDKVQMVTMCWDTGFSKVMATSLFDLLYPVQRELNKVAAKLQQMIRMYKGSVPVFNSDVDLAMKAISNGSGEALYVDSTRPIDSLMTVINPTPLDSQLDATITARKTEMYELAGIQQVSFDMENMRSAAAVIALDQTRDTVFQAQLDGMARFIASLFRTMVNYNATIHKEAVGGVDWSDVQTLIDDASVELKPVHLTDPLGNKGHISEEPKADYLKIQVARHVQAVLKGTISYEDIGYVIDKEALKAAIAATMVKLNALDIDVPQTMVNFMVTAFVDDVRDGAVPLTAEAPAEEAPPPEEPPAE